MAIAKGYVVNFETLKRACANGDLALVECTENATGQPAVLIGAVQREDNGDVSFTPLCRMFDGNPYKLFTPPQA